MHIYIYLMTHLNASPHLLHLVLLQDTQNSLESEARLELGSVNNWNGTTVKKLPTLWNMAVGGNWSTSVRRPSLPLWGIPSITSVIPPGEEHNQQLLCFSVTGAASQLGVLCYMHYTGSISKWLLTAVHSAVALWHAKLVILLC